jgi:hypothetical protein
MEWIALSRLLFPLRWLSGRLVDDAAVLVGCWLKSSCARLYAENQARRNLTLTLGVHRTPQKGGQMVGACESLYSGLWWQQRSVDGKATKE